MKISVKNKEKNIFTIDVETDPGRGEEAYKKTAREFAQHMNVAGFRKGKAPINMIEAQVGVDRIKSETMNNILAEILYEAFEKEKLEVISIPTIDKVDFPDPKAVIKIQATIELVPELKLGNYKGLKTTVDVPKFEEKEYLDQTLERISSQFTSFEESDKAAEFKDEINFDFKGRLKETGETMDSLKAEGFQTIMEKGRFIEGFIEQIVGMKAGDDKEIEVTFPADYHEEKLQDKPAIFEIKIHKVSKPVAPKIDDEFAKKVGSEDLADLKKRIVDEMKQIQEYNEKTASSEDLIRQVIASTEVEVPESMINREVDAMMHQIKQQVEQSGQNWEEVKEHVDKKQEEESAIERIKRSLVISAIIKEEKLEIAQEDMTEALEKLQASGQPMMNSPEMMNNLRLQILTDKALDLVRDNATVKYNYLTEEAMAKKDSEEKPKKKSTAKKTESKAKKPAKKAATKK